MSIVRLKEKYGITEYEKAQITLVTGKIIDKPYDLIWGCVELLHPEIPIPAPEEFIPGGNSAYRYFAHRAVVSADQALEWLDQLVCTHKVPLLNGNSDGFAEDEDKVITTGDFLSEPSWPSLTTMTGDSRFGIIPLDLQSPLVCSMWQDDCNLIKELRSNDQEVLIDWVKEKIGFDLGIDGKLAGSIHLIVDNPVFRKVELRLKPNEECMDKMNIMINTVLRENQKYESLTLILLDKRDTGWKVHYNGSVENSVIEVVLEETEHPREVMAMILKDCQLLFISEPNTFVYSLNMGFSVGAGTRRVVIRKGLSEESYDVNLRSAPEVSMIGAEPPFDGLSIIRKMRNRIRDREIHAKYDQVYLQFNQDKATVLLREILDKGNRRILFVDPYFSRNEFIRFVLAIPCLDATIEILSSTEIVKGCDPLEKIEIYNSLKIECERTNQKIDFRIMGSGVESIHDRFLLCDDRVWMLGSSLNAYGTRGTMLLSLPEPKSVIPELERVWKKAKTLEERIEEISLKPEAYFENKRHSWWYRLIRVFKCNL